MGYAAREKDTLCGHIFFVWQEREKRDAWKGVP